jgi:peptidoglycan/xylan/chitin deacetylase (PgdA/CDA1 family)
MHRHSVVNLAFRLAKSMAAGVCYYSGLVSLARKASLSEKGIKIINYHRIEDDDFDPLALNIKIEQFERQIRYLKKNYDIISLEDAVSLLGREKIPGHLMVVTFDDGYRNNYTNAFPILEAYEVPATIFLTVGSIGAGQMLWYDLIANAFKKTKKEKIDFSGYRLRRYTLDSLGSRMSATRDITFHVKKLSAENRDIFIANLLKELDVRYDDIKKSDLMLTWEDIARMNSGLITFGSHGMSHTILSHLSRENISREVIDSKRIIEEKTGKPVKFYAYPNGHSEDFSDEIELSLKQNGYTCACALISGSNHPKSDLFALKRLCLSEGASFGLFGNFSKALFAAQISGFFDHVRGLIGRNY